MNEQHTHEIVEPHTPVTYIIDSSQRSTSDLQSSYEKELSMQNDVTQHFISGGNHPRRKNGRSARTLLAAFLAGAVVIGGLSYMADKENLFSGSQMATNGVVSNVSGSSFQDPGVTTAALNTNESMATVYEAASPAVVKIENYTSVGPTSSRNGLRAGQMGRQQQQQSSELALAGTGSGFLFKKDGYILTNEHVIADAQQVKVTVQGYDEPLIAKVVGTSPEQDLAVLKVESPDGSDFPALTLGHSDDTSIGDWVVAIGNPYGLDHTLTMGVLSAKERPITITDEEGEHNFEHLLQTDASINPGNSGGPLLNEKGEVIGINTAVNSEAQGIGFAIPTTTIMNVLDDLMTTNSL